MKLIKVLASVLVFIACASSSAWSQFTPFCFGDGTSGPCPCANLSLPGTGGCLNSLATPGLLVGSSPSGFARISADISGLDRVTLTGSQMPNSFCVYFQGSANPPVLFGDGIRCVNAPFTVNLGTRLNVGGTSFVGGPPGPPISALGGLVGPVTREYQCFYRNGANFCTPALFNATNGVSIFWTP